jgi:hypothetical protein
VAGGVIAGASDILISASGLTDRSGGGSIASHDAVTDTGRKPALTQTIQANEEVRRNLANQHSTFNAQHSMFKGKTVSSEMRYDQ